jgi:hypothetical protein
MSSVIRESIRVILQTNLLGSSEGRTPASSLEAGRVARPERVLNQMLNRREVLRPQRLPKCRETKQQEERDAENLRLRQSEKGRVEP